MTKNVTVWFDGGCPLCIREISLMKKLDRGDAIEFVDVSNDTASECLIDRSALLQRFHASENGELLSGAEAFAAMWRAIPVLRPLGLLARNRMILRLLNFFYDKFLKIRPQFQSWAGK